MNEATEEHHLAHVLIAQLKKLKPSEEQFAAKFIVLGELCKHHIKEEESLMGSMTDRKLREVIIIGGGLAGLSAALYLGRSRRDTLLIHSGRSMAKWEADVQNYLGFPDGIDGTDLLTARPRAGGSFSCGDHRG